jgi:hypothetical protein
MQDANDSDFDWRSGRDSPTEHSHVVFELIHDAVRRSGSFRNLLYIESGTTPRIWSARAVQRWIYLDRDGKMMPKCAPEEIVP